MCEKRDSCRFWVVQPEEKRSLARPYGRWKDNMKMNVKEIGWEDVTCTFKHCNDLSVSIKCGEFRAQNYTTWSYCTYQRLLPDAY
jgi:predicted DNA-binding WGR domain protein